MSGIGPGNEADWTFQIWRRKGRRKWPPNWLPLGLVLLFSLCLRASTAANSAVLLKADTQLAPMEAATKRILMGGGGREDRTEEEENEGGDYVTIGPLEEEEGDAPLNWTLASPLALNESPKPRFVAIFGTGAPSTQAHISLESWERYQRFKEETCRKEGGQAEEEFLAEKPLNSTQSDYFHWEANEFHRQLRDRLLPQTRGGTFSSLIGSHLLSRLDPRLFASKPRSLCKAKRHVSEADERQKLAKEEQHMFEDFLINKVLPVEMFAPRRPSPSNAGNATRKAEL